jgi:hypothetical protein
VILDARHRDLPPVLLMEAMNRRDWETAGQLLAPDDVFELALSRERIVGRDAYIDFNRGYPGDWHIAIDQVVAEGDSVVLRLTVTIGDQAEIAIAFFELRDGLISRETDYWPEYYDPPEWRGERYRI